GGVARRAAPRGGETEARGQGRGDGARRPLAPGEVEEPAVDRGCDVRAAAAPARSAAARSDAGDPGPIDAAASSTPRSGALTHARSPGTMRQRIPASSAATSARPPARTAYSPTTKSLPGAKTVTLTGVPRRMTRTPHRALPTREIARRPTGASLGPSRSR